MYEIDLKKLTFQRVLEAADYYVKQSGVDNTKGELGKVQKN